MSSLEPKPILILAGPPGVGKTTAADVLAARSPLAVHLESDAFFRFIHSGYVPPWKPESHEQNRIVMQIVAAASSSYAAAGYFTVIDGIVIPGWFLEPLRDAIRDAGQRAAYAVLRAPLLACVARARTRAREPLSEPQVIEQLWRGFADLGAFEPHALEVGDLSPAGVADQLERKLQEGLLAI